MGCDIHLHIEVKIKGKWHHYSIPDISRNYTLFGKLAGVRREDETPIAAPRGLPDDATELTRYDCDVRWGPDGHSHSWIGAKEIVALKDWVENVQKWSGKYGPNWWMEDTFGYLFGNSFAGFVEYPSDCPEGLEDVRFVFWFDN